MMSDRQKNLWTQPPHVENSEHSVHLFYVNDSAVMGVGRVVYKTWGFLDWDLLQGRGGDPEVGGGR